MILSYHCLLFSNLYQYLNLFMYIINHKFKESLGYIANFNTAISQDHVSKHKSAHTQKDCYASYLLHYHNLNSKKYSIHRGLMPKCISKWNGLCTRPQSQARKVVLPSLTT